MALNPKQKKFCHHFLKCMNATEAAEKAGYGKKGARQQAHRLLTDHPDILEYLAKRAKKVADKADLTIVGVLEDIEAVKKKCMGDVEGYKFDPGAALRACELQGKYLKMFTDRLEIPNLPKNATADEVAAKVVEMMNGKKKKEFK